MPTISPRDVSGGHSGKAEPTSTVAPIPDASRQPATPEVPPQGDPALTPFPVSQALSTLDTHGGFISFAS